MDESPDTQPEALVIPAREPFVVEAPPTRTFKQEQVVALAGAVIITFVVVILGVRQWGEMRQANTVAYVAPVPTLEEPTKKLVGENPYTKITVGARAALVYDVYARKFLYTKQADQKLPLASLTKLMTALLAVESLDTNTHIAVSQNAIDTEGDSGLFANERWRLKDLVSFTLISSSNDGADALAAAVGGLWQSTPATTSEYEKVDAFVGKMNLRAQELNMPSMKFNNPTGLDEPNGDMGGMGTAKDVATLVTYIWEHEPSVLTHTDELARAFTSTDGYVHTAENTNEEVLRIPGMIGSKTGYTDMAGGNLAVLYNAGLDHPLVVVVLGSSKEGRFEDVRTLVDATYRYVDTGWYQFEVAGSTDEG